jgi:hypothetical protein
MKRFVALVSALLFALLLSESASAQSDPNSQTWLRDRRYREGAGIRVGDFELHPGIGADFGYDSNYLRRSENEDPIGSLRLRVSPHFSVATLGPQRREDGAQPTVNFRAEIGATYNEFIPVSGSDEGQDRLREQRNIGGALRLMLDILPGREWGGRLWAGVARTVRPTNEGDLNDSFNRIEPEAGAELIWTPGSGLLDWSLGYQFSGTFFESGSFSGLNNFRNDITTRGRWRFLPRTALMYDARFSFITYIDPASGNAEKEDSHPLRARIGLNGLVTPSFGLLALVGWGASFYQGDAAEVQDFDSVIGQLELRWYITPSPTTDPMKVSALLSSLSVGFIREFEDSFVGTYLEKDQGYVRFNYLFAGQFLLVVEGRAGAVVFPPQVDPDYGAAAAEGWTDVRVDGTLFGEWRIKDWLGVNAEVGYTGYFSDMALEFPGGAGGTDELAYQDIRAFIGVRVFW